MLYMINGSLVFGGSWTTTNHHRCTETMEINSFKSNIKLRHQYLWETRHSNKQEVVIIYGPLYVWSAKDQREHKETNKNKKKHPPVFVLDFFLLPDIWKLKQQTESSQG